MNTLKNNVIKAHSIWISDFHLGSVGCQEKKIKQFLEKIQCNHLFLNGDIFDTVIIKDPNVMKQKFQEIISQINTLHQEGTKIYLLRGNHDNANDMKLYFENITMIDELTYEGLNKKKYLVFHGDQCDMSSIIKSMKLARLGTSFYEWCLSKRSHSSCHSSHFSKRFKLVIKKILSLLFRYDRKLISYLKDKAVHGVICGHSHQPIIKTIKNFDYLNSGDWVHHCSYILETESGEFQLNYWDSSTP